MRPPISEKSGAKFLKKSSGEKQAVHCDDL